MQMRIKQTSIYDGAKIKISCIDIEVFGAFLFKLLGVLRAENKNVKYTECDSHSSLLSL